MNDGMWNVDRFIDWTNNNNNSLSFLWTLLQISHTSLSSSLWLESFVFPICWWLSIITNDCVCMCLRPDWFGCQKNVSSISMEVKVCLCLLKVQQHSNHVDCMACNSRVITRKLPSFEFIYFSAAQTFSYTLTQMSLFGTMCLEWFECKWISLPRYSMFELYFIWLHFLFAICLPALEFLLFEITLLLVNSETEYV